MCDNAESRQSLLAILHGSGLALDQLTVASSNVNPRLEEEERAGAAAAKTAALEDVRAKMRSVGSRVVQNELFGGPAKFVARLTEPIAVIYEGPLYVLHGAECALEHLMEGLETAARDPSLKTELRLEATEAIATLKTGWREAKEGVTGLRRAREKTAALQRGRHGVDTPLFAGAGT